jgi:hypothetical protein
MGEKKLIFSRTRRLISIKLDTDHARVKGIQVCLNKGQVLVKFNRENHESAEIG